MIFRTENRHVKAHHLVFLMRCHINIQEIPAFH